ncbi:MAG: PQQ-dependent sugar dehydrogenase [Oceanipulchritudo sp.]
MKIRIPLLGALLAPLLLFSQNRIGTGTVAELYRAECAVCHGDNLEGGLGGSLLGDLDYASGDESIRQWIEEGNPDLGMPAFGNSLSDPEIRSLVIYIREMRQKDEREADSTGETSKEAGGHTFRVEERVSGLSIPWSIDFLPDGAFLITERGGTLRIFRDGTLLPPVKGTPEVWAHGQGGLLEAALHPEYGENGWIYLGFSKSRNGEGSTAVVRGRIEDNRWTDEEPIFEVPEAHLRSARYHFGTRFVFKDGYLFFSIGDRGLQDSAQDPASPNGKVHRIHDDGRIPEDNPFQSEAEAFPSIWTLGNRNIQGLDAHPRTGEIWASEHGPRGGDEINLIEKGLNYGWPVITHGMNYNGTPITEKTEKPGMEQPALQWTPSIAVCGIDFYEGDMFPQWEANLFAGGLASEELHRLVIEGDEVVRDEIILSGIGRIRDVATGPDGALYLVLNGPDEVVRLVPEEKND